MPTEQLILTIMTGIIALLSLIVAFSGWLSNTKKDSAKQDAQHAILVTKVDQNLQVQQEIKDELKRQSKKIDEVDHTAHHALERAEAAHNRLNRAGIDIRE